MKTRSGKFMQNLSTCIVCCGAMQVGFLLGWSSPIVPMFENPKKYQLPFSPTFSEINWIVSIAPLGALSSCLLAGWIADRIGRKMTIIMTAIPSIICWLLLDIFPTVNVLLITRYIHGLCMGIIATIVPTYIGEIAETSIRGKLGTQFQLFLLGGEIIMFISALFRNYYVIAVPGIVCNILLQIGSFFIPETPFYLIANDTDSLRTETVLKRLRNSDVDTADELKEIERTVQKYRNEQPAILDVITVKANRKSIFIGIILMVFQQMGGVNAIIFYSQSIFETAAPDLSSITVTIVMGAVSFVMTLLSGYAVDAAGRKTLLIISGVGMAISFWILATNLTLTNYTNAWISVGTVFCFMISFCVGYGTIPWIIIGEVFSFEVKRVGNGLAVVTNFVFVFIVSYGFRLLLNTVGPALAFYIFGSFSVIGVIVVALYVPETKNKSFAEIQAILEA